MKLELKDMKISKVEVCKRDDTSETDATDGLRYDENILDPTSFALIIKRNLSSGWYKELPELDISGRLKSIVVCFMFHGFFRFRFKLPFTDWQFLFSYR